MKLFRGRKPSLALVISLVALFISLGGTSYAAITLPARSVGAKQLKSGAVTTAKIRKSAVTTAKIRNGAVTAAKINAASITDAALSMNMCSVPVAGGVVSSANTATPTINRSFNRAGGRPTVVRSGKGKYTITIPGVKYFYTHYATVVTPIDTVPCFAVTNSVSDSLLVYVFDSGGTSVDPVCFQFVTFQLQ
jgi:hypothetical protein